MYQHRNQGPWLLLSEVIFATAVGGSNGNLEEASKTFKESWIKRPFQSVSDLQLVIFEGNHCEGVKAHHLQGDIVLI